MGDRFDVLVVGAGTAGCVLASRLSERGDRSVCLVEAGPDYGSLAAGRWPAELLDSGALAFTHEWGTGGEDQRSLGGRVVGGSSAMNGCMVVRGTRADYDEWGLDWDYEAIAPYLDRARAMLRTAERNTDEPAPAHEAFLAACEARGLPRLADPGAADALLGAGRIPSNVVDGVRWNAAFAYLDPARDRPELTVRGATPVDRVLIEGDRAVGVLTSAGEEIRATTTIVSAGAYLSPAVLLRSGIGPAADLRALGIAPVVDLPVGERLLDHYGTSLGWSPTSALDEQTAAHVERTGRYAEPHAVVKARSGFCPPDSWDLHVLSWLARPDADGHAAFALAVFHMKPVSSGRVRLASSDPAVLPVVERGFFSHAADADVIRDGIELAREIAATEPLRPLLGDELRPGPMAIDEYVRATPRNYFHPAGTCPLGAVLDARCRVLGLDGLVVADASVMPTLPRANPNLTVAAIAERVAETL